ncbi:hypothetical protein FSARC_1861 [Fusarium sarcochroum]|uniref:Uncharacterized protein n=1 Tax=Fusarium sarcochroum TaxID=1208366 RepID=A0A8H4XEJ3_9HYPO|nr:hypothetical protein FSARC_1861 [Fusarium sarcochroum]
MAANDSSSTQDASMICLGSIVQVDDEFCHLNVTSLTKFRAALGFSHPTCISDLIVDSSATKIAEQLLDLGTGDRRPAPQHFYLSVDGNTGHLCVGDFATLSEKVSLELRDLSKLGESICRLAITLDLALPLGCLDMMTIPVLVNIYWNSDSGLSPDLSPSLYLQHPLYTPPGCLYDNPQFFGKVTQDMVGPSQRFAWTQLSYLLFEFWCLRVRNRDSGFYFN